MSETPTYNAWSGMIQRCENHNHVSFEDYGGRGITVCKRWKESFENFLSDVGERPSKGVSLDRVDNNGNYEPGNVRWATPTEQQLNRRRYVSIRQFSEREIILELARRWQVKEVKTD